MLQPCCRHHPWLSGHPSQCMLIPTAVGVAPNDQSTISGCLLQSYEDIGQAAFGSKGRAFITWVLYTELIGTCALFYILEVRAQEGNTGCSKLRRGGHSSRACSKPCVQRECCGGRLRGLLCVLPCCRSHMKVTGCAATALSSPRQHAVT